MLKAYQERSNHKMLEDIAINIMVLYIVLNSHRARATRNAMFESHINGLHHALSVQELLWLRYKICENLIDKDNTYCFVLDVQSILYLNQRIKLQPFRKIAVDDFWVSCETVWFMQGPPVMPVVDTVGKKLS